MIPMRMKKRMIANWMKKNWTKNNLKMKKNWTKNNLKMKMSLSLILMSLMTKTIANCYLMKTID